MNDTVDDAVTAKKRNFFWHVLHYGVSNQRDRRNQLRFTAWCFAWAVSFVAATWTIKAEILTGPNGESSLKAWLRCGCYFHYGLSASGKGRAPEWGN